MSTWERKLEALYAELPRLDCRGLCVDSCGPIGVYRREGLRLERASGRPPRFTADLRCTYLQADGRCAVYAVRPAICRLFGMIQEGLRCPFGCEPERWLTREEGFTWMQRVRMIAGEGQLACPDDSVPEAFARVFKEAR